MLKGLKIFEFLTVGWFSILLLPLFLMVPHEASYPLFMAGFALTFVVNHPHFMASYLLLYKNAKQKLLPDNPLWRHYWLAAVTTPLALLIWGVWIVFKAGPEAVETMLTLMYFLIGWHYTKQGFGVLMMLSAARGAVFSARESGLLLANAYFAWFAFYIYASEQAMKGGASMFGTYPFFVPQGATEWVLMPLAAAGLWFCVWAARGVWSGRLPFNGVVGYACAAYLWPICSRITITYAAWVPLFHGLQYLYFVHAYEKGASFSRKQMAWFGFWSVAIGALVFYGMPKGLEQVQSFADPSLFILLIPAMINIHHYVIDSVIWKKQNLGLSDAMRRGLQSSAPVQR